MAQSPTFDGAQSPAAPMPPLGIGGRAAARVLRSAPAQLEGPYRLVVLFLFLYYAFPRIQPYVRGLQTMTVLLVGIGAWIVLEKIHTREPFVLSWPESHALVFFLLAGGLSAWNSYWPGLAISKTIEVSKAVAIYFFIVNVITDRHRLRNVYWALVAGGAFAASISALRFFSGVRSPENRAIYLGVFRNPNDLAMALTIVIPLAICLFRDSRPAARLFLSGTIATCVLTIFLTFSRGGILGLGAAVVTMGARAGGGVRRSVIALVIIAVLAVPLYDDFWERESSYSNLEEDRSFLGRMNSIRVGIRMFLDSPIVGLGLGGSRVAYSLYDPWGSTKNTVLIHNTWVQLLAEMGLLGVFTYLGAFVFSLVRVNRIARGAFRGHAGDAQMRLYAAALVSSMVGFAVCGMSGPYLMFWVPIYLIAICSAMGRIVVAETLARPEHAGDVSL